MGKIAKWIVGGLGWAFFGPIGGLIGFLVGSVVDSTEHIQITAGRTTTTPGDYSLSLLVLIAAMLKADGKVLRVELDYVKQFLVQNFGVERAQDALTMLKDLLKQDIPVKDVCEQIAANLDYSSRLQLLHFMIGLAHADGKFHPAEEQLLSIMANSLGITQNDRESINAMFRNTIEDLYKILEIDSSATNEEVKKAYRSMAIKYHPDKVAYLGEDVKKAANEKFQKLNNAYEKIKKERGMV
jgi:DnaJ like chaperone protein